ncbi:DUF305 domain-containing protein [Sphingomonas sp.]|uniref:DUF305 domain-containing protein n=1 Tax=Sphingomonas sp. TaxID=28214 RepID=UPI00286D5EE3|nr:DUF305 domain-containing protein [Sphingomonas sp.]
MENDHANHAEMKSPMPMNMGMGKSPYLLFAANLLASGVVMYFVMYTMIDSSAELYNNLNNLYMTLMMLTSMALFMLWMMPSMFPDRRTSIVLSLVFAALFALSLFGMRTQALIGDNQFLRSMIPHHSGAILMCEHASIRDAEIQSLCGNIIFSQKQEIDQMKAILIRKSH